MKARLIGLSTEYEVIFVFLPESASSGDFLCLRPHPRVNPRLERCYLDFLNESGTASLTLYGSGAHYQGKTQILGTQSGEAVPNKGNRLWVIVHDPDSSVYPVVVHGAEVRPDGADLLDVTIFSCRGPQIFSKRGKLLIDYQQALPILEPTVYSIRYEFSMPIRDGDELIGKGSILGTLVE